ncbi:hypothetical protein C2S51_002788 [Perilla frutescens var. frutescens]|nr:hypothetical protein C2S51_002788 [Perilla frutescens var. frutescens]
MENDSNPPSPHSFKHKLKNSLCFSCCFRRHRGSDHLPFHHSLSSPSDDNPPVVWIKTKGPHDHSLSEIKEKCRTVLGFPGAKHKRHSSVEFRYDPLSYALNFEDGFDYDDEAPLKNFSARLPPSPPIPAAVR